MQIVTSKYLQWYWKKLLLLLCSKMLVSIIYGIVYCEQIEIIFNVNKSIFRIGTMSKKFAYVDLNLILKVAE